ncbi:MAG: bile acid:sodium symporter [Planctomycetaceae bacterium]
MQSFLKKQWFLIALVVLIAAGLAVGRSLDKPHLAQLTELIQPRIVTAFVLFLMSFSLDSRQLQASFRAPKPVLWASLVNLGLVPLMAWGLMPLQQSRDFAVGLMIAASVPCTLAAASVWTRKAAGNDAVSLLVTLLTNGVCFLVTPFWLNMTTVGKTELPMQDMIVQLFVSVVLPSLAGQLLQHVPPAGRFSMRHKTAIGVLAQACILTMVFSAAVKAGTAIESTGPGATASGVFIVWGSVIVLHLAAMVVALFGARRFRFSQADCAAVAFSASQKTLPIGLLLATDPKMFGNPTLGLPFAVFPMLMYHASQLFIDTAVADRWAAKARRDNQEPTEETPL